MAFEAVGRPVSEAAIERSIAVLDVNKDGVIDFGEFMMLAWMTQTICLSPAATRCKMGPRARRSLSP